METFEQFEAQMRGLAEWTNHQVTTRRDYQRRSPQFARKRSAPSTG